MLWFVYLHFNKDVIFNVNTDRKCNIWDNIITQQPYRKPRDPKFVGERWYPTDMCIGPLRHIPFPIICRVLELNAARSAKFRRCNSVCYTTPLLLHRNPRQPRQPKQRVYNVGMLDSISHVLMIYGCNGQCFG